MANTLKYLNHLMQNSGITPACSEEEHQAAEQIAEVFRNHGFEPEVQEFNAATFTKLPYVVIGVLLFVGAVLMGLGGALGVIGLLLLIAATAWFFLERLGRMGGALRGSVGLSQNVIAYHKASGPLASPRNRPVVVVAHYDSPRADLLSRAALAPLRPWLVKLMPAACVAPVVLAVLSLFPFPGPLHVMFWLLAIVCAALPLFNAVCIVLNKFFLPYTSGAVCNKSSVAAMLGVMDAVAPYQGENEFPNDIPADQYAATYRAPVAPGEIPYGPVETYQGGASAAEPVAPAAAGSGAGAEPGATVSMPAVGAAPQDAEPVDVDGGATVSMDMGAALDAAAASAAPAAGAEPVAAETAAAAPREALVEGVLPADGAAPEAVAAVRHGEQVVRALHMLPDTCAITYIYERPHPEAPGAEEAAVSATPAAAAPAAPSRAAVTQQAAPVAADNAAAVAPAPQPAAPQVPVQQPVPSAPARPVASQPAAQPYGAQRAAADQAAPAVAPSSVTVAPVAMPQEAAEPQRVAAPAAAQVVEPAPADATAVMERIPSVYADAAPIPVDTPAPRRYVDEAPVMPPAATPASSVYRQAAHPMTRQDVAVSGRRATGRRAAAAGAGAAPQAVPAASAPAQEGSRALPRQQRAAGARVAAPSPSPEARAAEDQSPVADDAMMAVRAAQAAAAHVEFADQADEDVFALPVINEEAAPAAEPQPYADEAVPASTPEQDHEAPEAQPQLAEDVAAPYAAEVSEAPAAFEAFESELAAAEPLQEDGSAQFSAEASSPAPVDEVEEDPMPTSAWRVTSDPAFGWNNVPGSEAAFADDEDQGADSNPYQTQVFNRDEMYAREDPYADAEPISFGFRLFPKDDEIEVAEAIVDGVVEEEPPAVEPGPEENEPAPSVAQEDVANEDVSDEDEFAADAEPYAADGVSGAEDDVYDEEAHETDSDAAYAEDAYDEDEPEPLDDMIDLVAPPAPRDDQEEGSDEDPSDDRYFEDTYEYEEDEAFEGDFPEPSYASGLSDEDDDAAPAVADADVWAAPSAEADAVSEEPIEVQPVAEEAEPIAAEDYGYENEDALVDDSAPFSAPDSDEPVAQASGNDASMPAASVRLEATQVFSAVQVRDAQDAAVDAMMAEIDGSQGNAPSGSAASGDAAWHEASFASQDASEQQGAGRPAMRASLIDLPDPSAVPYDPLGTGSIPTVGQSDVAPSARTSRDAAQNGQDPQARSRATAPEMANGAVDAAPEEESAQPKKRHKHHGFASLFGHKKKRDDGGSMSEWLGVSDEYDAKTSGREIGSWDNFENDTGSWKGGAASDGTLSDEELADAVASLGDDELLGHDIWFVATGASVHGGAGMQAFLDEHRDKLRGVFLINLECVGAGETSVVMREGASRTLKGDRRIAGLLNQVSADFHAPFSSVDMPFVETDASVAMNMSLRSITVAGVDPSGPRFASAYCEEDAPYNVDPQKVETVANVVTEVIRRS